MKEVSHVFVDPDPRGAADRILAYVISRNTASGGAVLQIRDGRLEAFVCRSIDVRRLADAAPLLSSHAGTLAAGDAVRGSKFGLFPITEGGLLVGLVFVDQPTGMDARGYAPFNGPLAGAFRADAGSAPVLAFVDAEHVEREKLLTLLRGNAWNVSRVASLEHVTRRTIYSRMERWGIERPPRS